MNDLDLQYLVYPLPEDIIRMKGIGDYRTAMAMVEFRLTQDIPDALRKRLEVEKLFLNKLPVDYKYTKEEIFSQFREKIPDFTMEELDTLIVRGKTDFLSVNGILRFHEDTVASLLKSQPPLAKRAGRTVSGRTELDDIIDRVKAGVGGFNLRIKGVMTLKNPQPGTVYRIHLPIAAESMQQSAARDITCSLPFTVGEGPQRTIYIQSEVESPIEFAYSYTQRPRYVNPLDESVSGIIYPTARPVCEEDLMEEAPHILFTPYLKALAKELKGDETDPVRIAYTFYQFTTQHVTYAYQRPYLMIENGAEYTALGLKGDCGLQALLFITLCRICGIPARWQSGLDATPGDVGSHDWAEFYSPRLGWLPVDCSFGGGALRRNLPERWQFYFGNLDPWRMVANRRYYVPFSPVKRFCRYDPYDSQRGEVETDERGLYGGEFRTVYELESFEEE